MADIGTAEHVPPPNIYEYDFASQKLSKYGDERKIRNK
jgi:hypothetical protein